MSDWGIQAEGPRTRAITVKEAEFQVATREDGTAIDYNGERLYNLVLSGPLQFLDPDTMEVTEDAEPPDGMDMPSLYYTVGSSSEFTDEDGTGVALTQLKRKTPHSRFDGGQLYISLVELAGPEWLGENLSGPWYEAATWVGHTLIIEPTGRTKADGTPVMRPQRKDDDRAPRQQFDSKVIGIDDVGAQIGEPRA